jgi:hypothetical protein
MSDHAEDPLAATGAKVAGYVNVGVVVAEAAAQMAAARALNRAATDEQRAAALRAQHQADYAHRPDGLGAVPRPRAARAGRRARCRAGLRARPAVAPGTRRPSG